MFAVKKNQAAVIGGLLLGASLLLSVAASADDRSEQILANLKLLFPQLEEMDVTMSAIGPTDFDGLDQGSFSINGGNRGVQTQKFLVSHDNTKLYLISGEALDVSKTKAEIDTAMAQREEQKAQEAQTRQAVLDKAIEGLPFRGKADAPITIVEFSDFQCPYCARGAVTVKQVLDKYDDVKFVFKNFPLSFHPWAKPAAIAAHCVAEQKPDAFWALHDKYFANQDAINPDNVLDKTKEFLADSGIDLDAWSECAEDKDSAAYKDAVAVVEADTQLGTQQGVTGTPGFFINGRFLNGAQPIEEFDAVIGKIHDAH